MLANCPSCPGFLPANAAACPHCGHEVARDPVGVAGSLATKAAKLATAGMMMATLMACYGGPYDDFYCTDDAQCGDGYVCDGYGYCVEEDCENGVDDDGDGLVDEADPYCGGSGEVCTDGIDNDEDGFADCEDSDCDFDCFESDCGNGFDDDGDGAVDCADSDCGSCPTTELECGDLFDNDNDGFTDCEDTDCDAACGPAICGDGTLAVTEGCDDGNVVDGDGCSATCEIEGTGLCDDIPTLPLGTSDWDSSFGTFELSAGCVPASGSEVLFQFTAAASGTLVVSLDSDHDMGLYVLSTCGEGAVELGCTNLVFGGGTETLEIPMAQAQTLLIVADDVDEFEFGDFSITANYVEQ